MKRPVALMPALVSLALLGTLVTGCAKKDHHLPSTEPTGAPCGGAAPSPTPAAASYLRSTAGEGQSRPKASITPGPEQSPTLSYVVINSDPAGLCAQIQSGSGNFSKIGNTPLKNTPPFSNTPYTYQIETKNGNGPYSYAYDQTANGHNVTVLFNQNADTLGQMTISTAQSYKHKTASRSKRDFSRMLRKRPATWANRPAFSSDHLEVRYRAAKLVANGRRADDIERSENALEGRNIGYLHDGLATRIVKVAQGDSIGALASRLQRHSEIYDTHPVALRYRSTSAPRFPNDTLFESTDQWDLFRIQVANAWGYTIGSTSVNIGIIDTGADKNNNDLGSKLVYGESDVNGVTTVGFTTAGSQDEDGHGTNVSGIASADTNNDLGVAGIGWQTPIDIYRIFPQPTTQNPSPGASTSDEAQAIYNAVGNQHVNVINLSLGSGENGGWDSVERDAVEYAIAQGVTVVAAAGNERTTTSNPGVDFPGAYNGVIAVGASALNDSADPCDPSPLCPDASSAATEYVASYSNSGPQLSIVAPGGDPSCSSDPCADADPLHWITGLYTTTPYDPSQSCATGPVCLALYAGTSQATPHVTGTVALMLAQNSGLTPANIKQILQSTADDINDPNEGYGRLDAYRALASASGDTNIPQPGNYKNFVAFAYDNTGESNQTVPHIIDVTYPQGVPVNADGTFRIADIMTSATKYRIAVWASISGQPSIQPGDYFAATLNTCSPSSPCTEAEQLVATPVGAGFNLP